MTFTKYFLNRVCIFLSNQVMKTTTIIGKIIDIEEGGLIVEFYNKTKGQNSFVWINLDNINGIVNIFENDSEDKPTEL